MTFAVAYLQESGWGIQAAASVLATWGVIIVPSHILWGMTGDRLNRKYLLVIALGMAVIGILIFLSGSTAGAYIGAAVISLGTVGVLTLLSASVADYFEPATVGTAYGFITFLFGVGAIIGPTIGGIFGDTTGTLFISMLASLGILVVGFVMALILRSPKPER